MTLPYNCLYRQIASHLQPLDLLHLARASLELRETLMSRKMRSVWIAARKNLDPPMPDCPEGMSEPAYASLVFEAQCIVSDRSLPYCMFDALTYAIRPAALEELHGSTAMQPEYASVVPAGKRSKSSVRLLRI